MAILCKRSHTGSLLACGYISYNLHKFAFKYNGHIWHLLGNFEQDVHSCEFERCLAVQYDERTDVAGERF